MTFSVEKYISNFIKNQFPAFYETEGPNFILFMEAYYEWLEQDGQAIGEARRLFEYRDIDTTISIKNVEDFLSHFQQKYLYGIPYNIITNKRFLLKHVLDVYRSKGTIRGYKLLFKLIYDEDIEVYIPAYDILKASHGTWEEPKYIEVADGAVLKNIRGKQVIGSVSKTTAVIETSVQEPILDKVSSSLYISNIYPPGANFAIGEKLLDYNSPASYTAEEAPQVLGSFDSITITSGGDGFAPGDILSIVERDPVTGEIVSNGTGGKLKITKTSRAQGSLQFVIDEVGTGYTANASIYFNKEFGDNSGYGASFKLGPLSYIREITYNTDIINDYANTAFNATQYDFPGNPIGNSSATFPPGSGFPLNDLLTFNTDNFGSVYTLTGINPGNNYIYAPNIYLRSSISSKPISATSVTYSNANIYVPTPGTISYSNTSNTISGTGTLFTSIFSNNDVIGLKSSNTGNIEEYRIITQVVNDTTLKLDSNATFNSTAYAKYYKVPYVIGNGTTFTTLFTNNDVIGLRSIASDETSTEYQNVRTVANDTLMILYGPTKFKSTATSYHFIAPSIMRSQFALYESVMQQDHGTVPGENELISAIPNNSNTIASEAVAYDSGKGYLDNEKITAYLFNTITTPTIISGGTGYANNEKLIFSGGTNSIQANGYITTNTSGGIVGVTLVNPGAGYYSIPVITVNTVAGSSAYLETTLAAANVYNTYSKITGKISKKGIGTAPGHWSTTRGFLNSDKYIQDSYYYQDYSYEIRVNKTLNNYRNIIYNTFHNAGMELFGRYLGKDLQTSKFIILSERNKPLFEVFLSVDRDTKPPSMDSDDGYWTSDINWFPTRVDSGLITSDNKFLTVDSTYLKY